MTISPRTGCVELPDSDFRVCPDNTLSEIIEGPDRTFWKRESLPGQFTRRIARAGYPMVIFRVAFDNNGRLSWISIFFDDPPAGSGWDDWSEADELLRKERQEVLLRGTLGPPSVKDNGASPVGAMVWKFAWGAVYSVYDQKASFSSVEVRFTNA
jgi:hypothetical protein